MALTERLCSHGLRAVPHLSARLIRDEAHVWAIATRLQALGVEDVFVVGGDVAVPVGPFDSAAALLAAFARLGVTFPRIGVAAYPDGHPRIDAATLHRALLDKQRYADYLVSQVCFDPRRVRGWIGDLRRRGVGLPLHVGLPGIVNPARLLRVARRIGVVDSGRFVGRHAGLVAGLFGPRRFDPDRFVDALRPVLADPALRVAGLHVYTFNEIAATERWRRRRLSGGSSDAGS